MRYKIAWDAVSATDFWDSLIKEGKQAEFLAYDTFPLHLIERIGVIDSMRQNQANMNLQQARHKPVVSVERSWYY